MKPVVTEEQLKSLKLFSYYLQSHGIKNAEVEYYIDGCRIDWGGDRAYGDGSSAELYDAIKETLEGIIESNDLADLDDCDNRGTLTIRIDCVERTLEADVYETVYGYNDLSDSVEISELEEDYSDVFKSLNELIEEIKSKGENTDKVEFSGGGDSGDINGTTNNNIRLDNVIVDYFYNWLENFYGGWEINEGSQGNFIIDTEEGMLYLDMTENTEEQQQHDIDFQIKF